jgi:hypothetical protein
VKQGFVVIVAVTVTLAGCAGTSGAGDVPPAPSTSVLIQPSANVSTSAPEITAPATPTPAATDPLVALPPDHTGKVYGTGSLILTSGDGYSARLTVTWYAPRQLDPSWVTLPANCGPGQPDPALSKPGAVAYAVRVQGEISDLKPGGFAWDFSRGDLYPGLAQMNVLWFPKDDVYQGGNAASLYVGGCTGETKAFYAPFTATSKGEFAMDAVAWASPTPKHPTVNHEHLRAHALDNAGVTVAFANRAGAGFEDSCRTGKLSKSIATGHLHGSFFQSCVVGPDTAGLDGQ